MEIFLYPLAVIAVVILVTMLSVLFLFGIAITIAGHHMEELDEPF